MRSKLLLFAKGIAMGAADVVPGVSGGTIAFISGNYDELLGTVAALPTALRQLLAGNLRQAWETANPLFLLILVSGILTSIFSFAGLITWLMVQHPIPLWAFFFGLVLVSAWLIGRTIPRWHLAEILGFAFGVGFAWWITVAAPVQWGHDPLSLFFAGAIAICAMILPGISGSFLLVLMGLYSFVLGAVKTLDMGVLLIFALGCVFGLLSFARLLSWMLSHVRTLTLTFLTGLMVGSLNKVWPWKQTLTWTTGRHGEPVPLLQQNLLPAHYAELTGQNAQLLLAIALAVAGVLLVLGLERLAQIKTK